MDELATIKLNARKFRRAIERCPRDRLPITFQQFPQGACGDAVLLLGTFLRKHGFGGFQYVLGYRRFGEQLNEVSHAWLQRDSIVVDITADQFVGVSQDVLVLRDSVWHAAFRSEVLHVADFRIYDDRTTSSLRAAYRAILESMDN